MRTALTIAGSDSGGGAGIQADLKTFSAFGVFGTSAITAITAQNTVTVTAVEALRPELVVAQIDAVLEDIGADAIKIGMLANAPIVEAVAAALSRHEAGPIVLDTVMVSKGGARLIEDDAVSALMRQLVPMAAVITPNVPEAEVLTGCRIESLDDLRGAAAALVDAGARAVMAKGGHLKGEAVDVLHDGQSMVELRTERLAGGHTHGTGCTLSSAIAARLALGDDLVSAVRAAKAYVTRAIAQAPGLGQGHGPLQHFPR